MSVQSDYMPDLQEIWSSLYGAFRLACFDENGHNHFNVSVGGFWRSFFAAVLVAPGYIVLASQGYVTEGDLSLWSVLVQALFYTLSWLIFPLISFFAVDLLSLGHRYTAMIVAINWSAVIEMTAMIIGIGLAKILPEDAAPLLIIAIVMALVVYQWFVIRTALQTSGGVAFAFVLFGLLLSAMLEQFTGRLM